MDEYLQVVVCNIQRSGLVEEQPVLTLGIPSDLKKKGKSMKADVYDKLNLR